VAGHSGPVYKVAWSPFLPSAFLSCSADWSVKLWHADADAPLLSMQSSSDFVADIQWSPTVRRSPPYAAPRAPPRPPAPQARAPRGPDAPPLGAQVSTVFAAVTGDGDVNIWDMSVSTLDPVFKASLAPGRPSAVRFAPGADVLVAGDSAGRVTVYALRGIDSSSFSHAEQVRLLVPSFFFCLEAGPPYHHPCVLPALEWLKAPGAVGGPAGEGACGQGPPGVGCARGRRRGC